MGPVSETFEGPATDYCLSWDDAGRCSLYPVPKEAFKRAAPPKHKGPRITQWLSALGVRVIRGAVMKAALIGFPMRVMWTFTVREKDEGGQWDHPRESVANGDIILSEELRRTLAALWNYRDRRGDERPFHNVWTAENPPVGVKNERNGKGYEVLGTRCPHIHLLTSWTFEAEPRRRGESKKAYRQRAMDEFQDFAAYVEGLWGLGWVHMEFLDNPLAAGAYLLKAAGYITKGAGKEQEPQPVRGQRWYVSDAIRPVRESKPVELKPETVRRLHALRYVAKDVPTRLDGRSIVISRYCVNGYGVAPDAFVSRVEQHAAGYCFSSDFAPDAEALAEADRQQAENTPEAVAVRHREVVRRFYTVQESYAVGEARRAAEWAALEVVALCDTDGVERWRRDPYEEDPDPSNLEEVA